MFRLKKFLKNVVSILHFSSKIITFDISDVTFNQYWTIQTEDTFFLAKQGRMCYFSMQVKLKGTTTSNTILTLPDECKPLHLQSFVVHGSGTNLGEIVVYTTGEVEIWNYGSTSSSLSGAAYVALPFCYVCA